MATAELAVAMPAVLLLLSVLLTVGGLVVDQVRCQDAARAGARWAARGESTDQVRQVAAQAAPRGATVLLSVAGRTVTVRVSTRRPAVPLVGLGSLTVTSRATAALEGLP